jgi:hypothetical protein
MEKRKRMAGAALHGNRASRQGLFKEGFDLRAQAGFAMGEKAEAFNSGAADDIGWIVVQRLKQAGGAYSMGTRLGDARDDQSQVGARSPIVIRAFAEESEQALCVGGE